MQTTSPARDPDARVPDPRADPTHGPFVGLGVRAAAVVFVLEARRRGARDERLVFVGMGALVGGAIFMRMGTWLQPSTCARTPR